MDDRERSDSWISPENPEWTGVPEVMLVAARAIWSNAESFAAGFSIDSAAAADALTQAARQGAEYLLKRSYRDKHGEEIRDLKSYLFGIYKNLIFSILEQYAVKITEPVDLADWLADRNFSDRGKFSKALEDDALCNEIFRAMPPRMKSIAVAQFVFGYSIEEIAREEGTTKNAVQVYWSKGIRKIRAWLFGKGKNQTIRRSRGKRKDQEKGL